MVFYVNGSRKVQRARTRAVRTEGLNANAVRWRPCLWMVCSVACCAGPAPYGMTATLVPACRVLRDFRLLKAFQDIDRMRRAKLR